MVKGEKRGEEGATAPYGERGNVVGHEHDQCLVNSIKTTKT